MHSAPFFLAALLPLITTATNVVLSNDDGWAEINIRAFYNALTAAGDSVLLSAPAENESGTGIYKKFLLPSFLSFIQQKHSKERKARVKIPSPLGSSDAPATPLTQACEFDSCPTGSPAQGSNASNTRFNYVNSFPVTAMRYGIQTLAPKLFGGGGGGPDVAVAGFNVGCIHPPSFFFFIFRSYPSTYPPGIQPT